LHDDGPRIPLLQVRITGVEHVGDLRLGEESTQRHDVIFSQPVVEKRCPDLVLFDCYDGLFACARRNDLSANRFE
jgi:hypothetical protein